MASINIYIADEEKKILNDTRYKYHVSMSTLADIVSYETYYSLLHYRLTETDINKFLDEYIYPRSNKKTSIKPRCYKEKELLNNIIKNKARFTTNALNLYAKKEMNKYIDAEGMKYYNNAINKKLQKAREQFWDYNDTIRSMTRALKSNSKYFRKKLDQIEGKK